MIHKAFQTYEVRFSIKMFKKRTSFNMEVPPRFELGSGAFAELCLTTWLWHPMTGQKSRIKNGASDEARTRYLHLGKVALYQMSYTRIFLPHRTALRGNGASGRNRTNDTRIFSPLLYQLSYRGIFLLTHSKEIKSGDSEGT